MSRWMIWVAVVWCADAIASEVQSNGFSVPEGFAVASCDYETVDGIPFVFAEKAASLQRYGYQQFSLQPEVSRGISYARFVGREGKFLLTETAGSRGVWKFHDILMKDCTKLYLQAIGDALDDSSARLHGIELTGRSFPTMWKTNVRVDRMSDAKTCTVMPDKKLPIPAFMFAQGGVAVSVLGGDFPGRNASFRVDKNPAIEEPERLTQKNARKLIDEIRAGGSQLLVGSYAWPTDVQVLREFNLEGIIPKIDECLAELR